MADIFGRADSPYAGSFAADASFLQFAGQPGAKNLVQGLDLAYNQPIQTLFEIGSNYRYYVVGRASGNMTVQQILGPTKLLSATLARLGNPCAEGERALELTIGGSACTGVGVGETMGLRADACVAAGINFGLNAQDLLLRQGVQISFGQLRQL